MGAMQMPPSEWPHVGGAKLLSEVGTHSVVWQEAKLALFCSQFLLFLNKKVEKSKELWSRRNAACVTAEWCFSGLI